MLCSGLPGGSWAARGPALRRDAGDGAQGSRDRQPAEGPADRAVLPDAHGAAGTDLHPAEGGREPLLQLAHDGLPVVSTTVFWSWLLFSSIVPCSKEGQKIEAGVLKIALCLFTGSKPSEKAKCQSINCTPRPYNF